MEKIDIEKSQEPSTPINSNTKCNSKQSQTVAKANAHPEWLPEGWNVDVRIRKSGANSGSVYKCYIDPLNGYKFYSKPEVLRYLETIKDNSCTSKKKKCTNTHSPSNVVVEKSFVEDLPPGWIKEVKVRKTGNGNKKDVCYIDPLTGHKFFSKPEVLRYLETIKDNSCTTKVENNSCTTKEEQKCTNAHSPSNVVVEKFTVEDLPPGWIKEVKVRKNGNGIRKDPFYIDPVGGYVFRSKKDVQRYIESGDIGTCAFKPSRRQIQDEDKSSPSPAAKRQKLKQSAPKKQLFVGKEIIDKSSSDMLDADSSRKGQDAKVSNPPEMKKTSDPDNVQEKEQVVNVMGNANEKNHSNPSISKTKEFNVHHRSSRRLAGIEPVQLADNVINDQTLQVPKRNLRSRTTLDVGMETKSSQHFNGVPEIEHVHKIPEVINTSHNLSEDQAVFKEQPHQLETDKAEDNKPEIRTDSNKSSNKERDIPRRASKRLAGFKHELMSNSISCDKAPKNKSKMSRDEVNSECLPKKKVGPATELADHAPITDDQLEKVEDEEMDDEKSEPQLSFAFHYSWSDPSLESAINTLTSVLPAKDSVDNGPTTVLETDIQQTPFDKVLGRSKDRNPSLEFANTLTTLLPAAEDSVDNGPTTVLGTDIQKTSLGNVAGRSKDRKPQVRSNKSKIKKELKLPMRLSKRLAGLEPEVLPSERPLEYVSRKSSKEEPVASATTILTNGAPDHLDSGEETKLTLHASDSLKTEVLGESSNKGEKLYDTQNVSKEQLQKVEAEKIGDERTEPQLPLLFGDPWSDPCLEFAIKTLTGALPVDAAEDILPVMTPDVNNLSNKELHESVVMSINEAHDKSNQSQDKKDLNMVTHPSELFPGQPVLRTSSTSYENAPTFTTRESYNDEGNITRNLDGEPLHIEARNGTQLVHHSRNISTLLHEEPLKEKEQVLQRGNITMEQPPLETENHDKPESQFCSSFMNSWSDPCLEFAFKTLTGAIPVEENLSFQGCFQEPANCHDKRDGDSTLPHFGSSSFSQNDISFHYDMGVESRPGQQSSMSSSFPPLEKANLQGCAGTDPPKHHSQGNENFQR